MATRKDYIQPQHGGQGFARTMKTFGRRVTVTGGATGDDVTGNIVAAFTLPAGFVPTGIVVVSSAFAAGLAFTVGTAATPNLFLTTGVPAATNITLNPVALLVKLLVETEVLVTIGTQAAGNVAGTIDVFITGFMDH